MLQRTGPQLLFLIALCSVLYSRTLSLPYTSMRPARHADGLFTSGYSKLLGQLSARRYLESLIGKRVNDELMEEPVKRHSDAIFTDNYSRFRKQMAVKKYLNSVLTGKRSLEDPGTSDLEESRDEPNTFPESYDDINVDHLLNNFNLPLWGGARARVNTSSHPHETAHSKTNTVLIQRTFKSQISQWWCVLQRGYLSTHPHSTCLHCIYTAYIYNTIYTLFGPHWATCVSTCSLNNQCLKMATGNKQKYHICFLSEIAVVPFTFNEAISLPITFKRTNVPLNLSEICPINFQLDIWATECQ